jgi:hypothetical protein
MANVEDVPRSGVNVSRVLIVARKVARMVNVMDVNLKGKAVYLILIVVIKIVLVMYVVGVDLCVAHEGTLVFQPMIVVKKDV